MSGGALFVGFDLGTTNSAAAVFDGERAVVVRNAQGGTLTPSAVRIDAKGRVTVGAKALRHVARDPDNIATEFKRLMGSDQRIAFPGADRQQTPHELSAHILESLCRDVEDQLGVRPTRAVVSVPALFELPQSAATSKAAELAGLEEVELLQEPIASALAAGWSRDDDEGYWLVYDLGGGTFDVSLLDSAEGFLRVVGHDGDNFLGGRDFDWALVDWAIGEIEQEYETSISRSDPAHAAAVAQLKRAAEDAKIELSRATRAELAPPGPLPLPEGEPLPVELELSRAVLERCCTALVDRSIDVCQRLLDEHAIAPGDLQRIVFVGGPTAMPFLRHRVAQCLGAPVAEGLDPMTVVAQGAAIYAATSGLDGRPPAGPLVPRGRELWLQYPPVSPDLTPFVVGRPVGEDGPPLSRIALVRDDGLRSETVEPDDEGGFAIQVTLRPRRAETFTIEASDPSGNRVEVHPVQISIVQGITITDPPLSRSIGVALANDRVQIYLERGTPLPARCTFTHTTVESVAAGAIDSVLKVPLVQGELEYAHLCRLVGTLEIPGTGIGSSLPSGSSIELSLEVDRGGSLSARALIPALDQVFEHVAALMVPPADPDALARYLEGLRTRVEELRGTAFRDGLHEVLQALERVELRLSEVDADLAAARGGNEDAGQRARRNLIEVDAAIDAAEQARSWPELESDALSYLTCADAQLAGFGTDRERSLFDEAGRRLDGARKRRDVTELQRQLRLIKRLGQAAWYRDPDTWPALFERAASRVHEAQNLPRAQQLVTDGRKAVEREDTGAIRAATEALWKLLPQRAEDRRLGFDSGIR